MQSTSLIIFVQYSERFLASGKIEDMPIMAIGVFCSLDSIIVD